MSDNLNVDKWVRFAQMDYKAAEDMSILHHPVPLENAHDILEFTKVRIAELRLLTSYANS